MTVLAIEQEFLRDDLYDALRWLFEGAVVWEAARMMPQRAGRHQAVLGMYTSLVQARALYEFYYRKKSAKDDVRVKDFAPRWKPTENPLYKAYMDQGMPAQKRVFHLVRDRSAHAGGTGNAALNKKVLEFAQNLRGLTEEFGKNADPAFQSEIHSALARAIEDAEVAAKHYGIPNPL